ADGRGCGHRDAPGRPASGRRARACARRSAPARLPAVDVPPGQHGPAAVPDLVVPARGRRRGAGGHRARARAPADRGRLGADRRAPRGAGSVPAGRIAVHRRLLPHHADALVAEHAAPGHRLAAPGHPRVADEGPAFVRRAVRRRRPGGMGMTEATAPARLPRQIPYIIGNEGCERFSFYGMRNILVPFLVGSVLLAYLPESMRDGAAKDVFHTFVIGVYFFPLLGGWLSDRFFGKYNTVLWLSLVYVAGHACLALFESSRTGFYTGLFLIALGSGGIKPLVSAFVGDQFDRTNKHLAKVVYDAFYWIINFGSFFASL